MDYLWNYRVLAVPMKRRHLIITSCLLLALAIVTWHKSPSRILSSALGKRIPSGAKCTLCSGWIMGDDILRVEGDGPLLRSWLGEAGFIDISPTQLIGHKPILAAAARKCEPQAVTTIEGNNSGEWVVKARNGRREQDYVYALCARDFDRMLIIVWSADNE